MSSATKLGQVTSVATQSQAKQPAHQTNIKPAGGFELKQTELAVHNIGKNFFGRIVPYYQLCVKGVDDNQKILQSVNIPVARFQDALQLMKLAYNAEEKQENENFSQWGARKGYPFFTEMLEELLRVGPDDLPQLLNVELNKNALKDSGLNIL